MLCVSVSPHSRTLAKVDLVNAAQRSDLVELCLDQLVKEPNVADLLQGIDKPVLISCRREEQGGSYRGSEEQRLALLRQAIVAGPAYVELEHDIAGQVPRFGNTKRVVSFTRTDERPRDLDGVYEKCLKLDADVVKLAYRTETLEEAWSLLAAVAKKRDKPLVGIGFGASGRMLTILGLRYGAPWVYAALEPSMRLFDGQATLFDLQEIYDSASIGPQTRFVGIIGFGDREELTIRTLNAGFRKHDLPTRCLPLHPGRPENLPQPLKKLGIQALFVDPRQGPAMLPLADHVDATARRTQSADFLLERSDGWHAYAVLWKHAVKALEAVAGQPNAGERSLERRNVLILGASGLAPSLCYGIGKRHGTVAVTAPDEAEAAQLAHKFDARHVSWNNLYDTLMDVIVIADPHLTAGHRRGNVNPAMLRPPMAVMDLNEMPEDSSFVDEARARSCRVVEPAEVYRSYIGEQFQVVTGRPLE